MRKLVVTNIVSLDGCFTGPGGDISAMPFDAGFSEYNAERLREAGTLLLGADTYAGFKDYWPQVAADPDAPELEREIARLNGEMEKVVVSDRLEAVPDGPWGTVRAVRRADAHAEVAKLKAGEGKEILVFGSHVLWNDLLAAGLVDELHLIVAPGVIGNGVPAFTGPGRFQLLGTQTWPGTSLVLIRYSASSA
ncbi:MAG TPA: dihydrofolate reductase family protein [Actinophytocola sp.]|jgi:dihydrofolate reductase|nr:dihydrofolate reductase family protein [Actinophytocola sp.]